MMKTRVTALVALLLVSQVNGQWFGGQLAFTAVPEVAPPSVTVNYQQGLAWGVSTLANTMVAVNLLPYQDAVGKFIVIRVYIQNGGSRTVLADPQLVMIKQNGRPLHRYLPKYFVEKQTSKRSMMLAGQILIASQQSRGMFGAHVNTDSIESANDQTVANLSQVMLRKQSIVPGSAYQGVVYADYKKSKKYTVTVTAGSDIHKIVFGVE